MLVLVVIDPLQGGDYVRFIGHPALVGDFQADQCDARGHAFVGASRIHASAGHNSGHVRPMPIYIVYCMRVCAEAVLECSGNIFICRDTAVDDGNTNALPVDWIAFHLERPDFLDAQGVQIIVGGVSQRVDRPLPRAFHRRVQADPTHSRAGGQLERGCRRQVHREGLDDAQILGNFPAQRLGKLLGPPGSRALLHDHPHHLPGFACCDRNQRRVRPGNSRRLSGCRS